MQGAMKVIEMTQAGGPEVLAVGEREIPHPGAGEVLIKVHAAGVNRPDVAQRQGHYPPPKDASDLLGLEVSGEIVAGDVANSGFALGDKVCALTPGGGYAEYVTAPVAHCLPIPKGLTMVEAAGLPETFFTVWSTVFERCQLSPGETLLVHGGASGIGTTAIQLAKAFGHTVYATAGSDERVQAIEALGCDRGINYKTQDFAEEIKQLTQGRGVDVILDMVAGDYMHRNLKSLAVDGRCVIIGVLGGTKGEINGGLVLMKRLTLTGATLRPRSNEYKATLAQALRERVWPLIEAGQIKPLIHATFDLSEARQAHEMMDAGEQIGKIILTVAE